MHKTVREFCNQIKEDMPQYFKDKDVLDVGSMDINGTTKEMFEGGTYTGIDLKEGRNVDKVCPCHKMIGHFDVIISTEAFEHDKYLTDSLENICKMLNPGGLFLFTCATKGRKEHGTSKHLPEDSASSQVKGWKSYYKNVTKSMVEPFIKDYFDTYAFRSIGTDLQFFGIRNEVEV